jgi:hypothetical protein
VDAHAVQLDAFAVEHESPVDIEHRVADSEIRRGIVGAAALLLLSGTAVLSQSGGSKGSGDCGGEKPYGGNIFREDGMNQPQDPAGTSPYQTGLSLLKDGKYGDAIPHLNAAVARKPADLLQKHDADAAASQARALERLCPSGCDERKDLDAAIAKSAPTAQH